MTATDMPDDVKAVVADFTTDQRKQAFALRKEIYSVTGAHSEIGTLRECLKWGEPSYLPAKMNVGSTIRIAPMRDSGEIALFFICTSGLVDKFKEIYPDTFIYHENRAVTFHGPVDTVREELHHIIALALTSKLRRKQAA